MENIRPPPSGFWVDQEDWPATIRHRYFAGPPVIAGDCQAFYGFLDPSPLSKTILGMILAC